MKWNVSGIALGLALVLLLAGCGDAPETVTPTITPTETPTLTPTVAPLIVFPTATKVVNTAVPVLTVSGQIKDVAAKSLVVHLVQADQGISTIALTNKTVITTSAGATKKWQDLKAGMAIQATGTKGSAGSIVATRVRILAATPTPKPDMTRTPTRLPTVALSWQRIQIPDIRISLEIPAGWPQGDGWSWTRPGATGQRVGVRWADRQAGAEPIVMLPPNGVVRQVIPTNTSLGRAMRYTIRITGTSAAEGHDVIMTDSRFIDVYAIAPSDAELTSLQTALSHMFSSVSSY